MEKKMMMIGPVNNLNTLIRGANEMMIKKEDVVKLIQHSDGTFSLIYFG